MNVFAEIVVNIEAPIEGTYHYSVPRDMRRFLRVGHLVEIEFGRRLAQGIVIGFSNAADVEETKPVMSLIDNKTYVTPAHIELARWLSRRYLAPLNGCLRLMLPPGITRWSDITVELIPGKAENASRLTPLQKAIIEILQAKGDRRGQQIRKDLPKKDRKKWQTAVHQLARRGIVRKATILDPPRMRPKKIRTAELVAGRRLVREKLPLLGRKNKQADILYALLTSADPLPPKELILAQTGATENHLKALIDDRLVQLITAETIEVPGVNIDQPDQGDQKHLSTTIEQPITLALNRPMPEIENEIFRLKQATAYQRVINFLANEARPVNVSDIYAQADVTLTHLKKMVKADLLRFGSEEVWRDPLADRDFMPAEAPMLTGDQARVWGRIKVNMLQLFDDEAEDDAPPPTAGDLFSTKPDEHEKAVLVHGVTGSGKTEIYMRAIDHALESGKTAIVLVPEIALTPQTVRRFAARFPGRVAVMHSRLSDGERYDTWRRARQGLFDIIVGPRSAMFVPMPNLGVIVLDEEHDASYKQTPPVPAPYYHTRDVAIALGRLTKSLVIMGSATPDVVVYHRARSGIYHLLELPRRVMGHRQRIESQATRLQIISQYMQNDGDPDDALTIPLPPIQVVDLRQELRAGNRSIFSRALQTAMDETIERGEQAILFLNRRGTASFVICRDCGHSMKCPNCDIPLTYHRPHLMLTCHQCGFREPQPSECPSCTSKRIKYFGLGTEQLEEQVKLRWPEARITRWDRDTTAGRNTHENLLASFINQEANVLVGTQMIAKGLDLPLVTLVAAISADVSLGLPDYHTGERAFQLLAQVAGRAGRGLLGGRVILQTYQPEHYAIEAASEHDFISFYLQEIRFRTQHNLPPFRRVAKLLFSDHNNVWAEKEAQRLASELRWHILDKSLSATEVLGPQPPFFARIGGRYRWQIILRTPDPLRALADFPIPPRWVIDIDPVSLL